MYKNFKKVTKHNKDLMSTQNIIVDILKIVKP